MNCSTRQVMKYLNEMKERTSGRRGVPYLRISVSVDFILSAPSQVLGLKYLNPEMR